MIILKHLLIIFKILRILLIIKEQEREEKKKIKSKFKLLINEKIK